MSDEEDLVVVARVLPENKEVYETLLRVSLENGLSADEVNTQLFNSGLFQWVSRISTGLAKGPEAGTEGGTDEE